MFLCDYVIEPTTNTLERSEFSQFGLNDKEIMNFLGILLPLLSIWQLALTINPCSFGSWYNGKCECFAGYYGGNCDMYNANLMPNRGSVAGMNLGSVTYYSTEYPFVDVMKMSKPWVTQRTSGSTKGVWDTKEQSKVAWRADGYPSRLAANMKLVTLMLIGTQKPVMYPKGRYICLYDGEGDLFFKFSATVVKQQKGRIELDVNPDKRDGGILMEVRKTNQQNPIRNIRVIMPGFESRYQNFPFHPAFMDSLRDYSLLRFMDWGHTNRQPEQVTWSTRTLPSSPYQTTNRGVALELMVDLSNRLGASPWICVPHAADDGYVWNMANLLQKTVRKDLKIVIEYSNEVWNGIFSAHKYAAKKGGELKLSAHPWENAWLYYSYRSAQIFKIFNQVFKNERKRIVLTVGTQTFNPYVTGKILGFQDTAKLADAVAITAYLSCDLGTPKNAASSANMSVTQMFTQCRSTFAREREIFKKQMELAKKYNLAVLTYEAGQHIVEANSISNGVSDSSLTDKFIAMNRDTRMKQLMLEYMHIYRGEILNKQPGAPFPAGVWTQFSSVGRPSKYGSWGVLEYQGQDPYTAPKYQALHQYMASYGQTGVSTLGPACKRSNAGLNVAQCCTREKSQGDFMCFTTFQTPASSGGKMQAYRHKFPYGGQGGRLLLDAANFTKQELFLRRIDKLGVTSYLLYIPRINSWRKLSWVDYFKILYNPDNIPATIRLA